MNKEETIPAGYKQTEIGVIPEDWRVHEIENVADVLSGKRIPKGRALTENNTPYPYISVSDMEARSVNLENIRFVPEDVYPLIKKYRIFVDDIYISVAGTLGLVGTIPKKLNGANLTENADRLTNIKCDKNYLLYILSSSLIQKTIDGTKTLGAQPKLALTRIRKFCIAIPQTKSEQAAIATVLSDTDALIEHLGKLIAKKKAIKQGAMQQLLTGKKRLPGFSGNKMVSDKIIKKDYKQTDIGVIPSDWVVKKLANVASLKARIGWQGLTTVEYKDSGEYYLITGTDFKNGFIDWENCHYVEKARYNQDKNIQIKEHDVLVTKDGTIGKVALINRITKPATLNSGVFVIRPFKNEFFPEYFYYLLLSEVFYKFLVQLSAGSTINHLYQKDFVSFSFQVPSNITEQTAIAIILSDMDAEIEKLEQKKDKYTILKQGMMQQLLTGRIRIYANN